MKIMDNGIIRDMTAEEEAAFIAAHQNQDEPTDTAPEEALTRYANALTGANDPDLISAAETLIEQRIKEGGE